MSGAIFREERYDIQYSFLPPSGPEFKANVNDRHSFRLADHDSNMPRTVDIKLTQEF